jgi:deoxyribonuclease-4
MVYIGCHTHIAGGLENAAIQAHDLGANAFALFTKNQRQWTVPPLTEGQITAFRSIVEQLGFSPKAILPHDSYLINLGSPVEEKLRSAQAAFLEEMRRCDALHLEKLNFHPGSHLNQISVDQCLRLVAQSIDLAIEQVPTVMPVIETTAGQGTNVGSTFQEIRDIIGYSNHPEAIGVCIDTCHIFAAGYDIRTRETYEKTFETFGAVIGFPRLAGMHLNDAKSAFGSHVDRHASIGEGAIGKEPFSWIVQDPRFQDIPLILETPDETKWKEEIALLFSACHADHA